MNKLIATHIDHIRNDYALMWHQDHLREIVNIIKSDGSEEFKFDCIEEKVYFANIGLRNKRAKGLIKNFWSMSKAVGLKSEEWNKILIEFAEKIILEIDNPDFYQDLISEGAIDGAVLAILAQIDAMEER